MNMCSQTVERLSGARRTPLLWGVLVSLNIFMLVVIDFLIALQLKRTRPRTQI